MKGSAVVMTLIVTFILTFGAFSLLVFSMHHYSSTKNLIQHENARNACHAAAFDLIHRYNFDGTVPWNGQTIEPWDWNGYRITGKLASPWNAKEDNLLTLSATKGTFTAEFQFELRQRRLEDFAFFSETAQSIPVPGLFDGVVFVRSRLDLLQPLVRFREFVHANVQPEVYASFRRLSYERLDYPHLQDFLSSTWMQQESIQKGILISNQDPMFWNGSSYVLDLDLLQIQSAINGWKLVYAGNEIGEVPQLHLWFDDTVRIKQQWRPVSYFPSGKPVIPFYAGSISKVILDTDLSPVESGSSYHPLCVIAAETITISSQAPLQSRFYACLAALGSETINGVEASLIIESGGSARSGEQKQGLISEIATSAFLFEPDKKQELIDAIDAGEKLVWFRGSLILGSLIVPSGDVSQIHFEASRSTYSSFPSFPFIYAVEGSKRWP